jgi:hypothetical protein
VTTTDADEASTAEREREVEGGAGWYETAAGAIGSDLVVGGIGPEDGGTLLWVTRCVWRAEGRNDLTHILFHSGRTNLPKQVHVHCVQPRVA